MKSFNGDHCSGNKCWFFCGLLVSSECSCQPVILKVTIVSDDFVEYVLRNNLFSFGNNLHLLLRKLLSDYIHRFSFGNFCIKYQWEKNCNFCHTKITCKRELLYTNTKYLHTRILLWVLESWGNVCAKLSQFYCSLGHETNACYCRPSTKQKWPLLSLQSCLKRTTFCESI